MNALWIPDEEKTLAKNIAKEVGGRLLYDEDEGCWFFSGPKWPTGLTPYTKKPKASNKKTGASPIKESPETSLVDKVFVLDVPYEERATVSRHGGRWDGSLKATTWTGKTLPEGLRAFMSPEYSYERWYENQVNKIKARPKEAQPGFKLRPHQATGAQDIVKAYEQGLPGFLIADEVGLGKTMTAWTAVRKIGKVRKVLIISPLAVVPHWRNAIKMMGDGGIEIIVINYDRLQKLFEIDRRASKLIKSRKGVARYAEAEKFDVVIADEAHKCRNPTTARSKLLAKLVARARFTLWLSATAGQNPLELSYLAPLLCKLTGASMTDLRDFEQWCRTQNLGVKRGAFGKWEWGGNQEDCDKIHQLLFKPSRSGGPGGLRRRPEDLSGWPEINRILLPIELTPAERRSYDLAWGEFRKAMKMSAAGKQSQNGLVAQLRLRQKMSLLRVSETVEQALDLRDNGHQVAISVAFLETLEAIKTELEKAGQKVAVIHGKIAANDKEKERMDFQTGKKPIVLFTVEEGISLHQGEHNNAHRSCIIHDLRWSAISMSQIEGRCHRDGKFAQVYWAFGANTVEAKIAQIVVGRILTMKRMIGDDPETLKAIEAMLLQEGQD